MLKKTLKRSFVLWKIRQKIEKFKNAIRGGMSLIIRAVQSCSKTLKARIIAL